MWSTQPFVFLVLFATTVTVLKVIIARQSSEVDQNQAIHSTGLILHPTTSAKETEQPSIHSLSLDSIKELLTDKFWVPRARLRMVQGYYGTQYMVAPQTSNIDKPYAKQRLSSIQVEESFFLSTSFDNNQTSMARRKVDSGHSKLLYGVWDLSSTNSDILLSYSIVKPSAWNPTRLSVEKYILSILDIINDKYFVAKTIDKDYYSFPSTIPISQTLIPPWESKT